MEGTGVNLTRKALQPYFDAGAAKVVVSAPVKEPSDPVLNIVVGCNEVRRTVWQKGARTQLHAPADNGGHLNTLTGVRRACMTRQRTTS